MTQSPSASRKARINRWQELLLFAIFFFFERALTNSIFPFLI